MIKVGIFGASGYAGGELVRLLSQRDDVEIVFASSRKNEGSPYTDQYPNLNKFTSINFKTGDILDEVAELDVLFCALPHGTSLPIVSYAVEKGIRVIDLSADFRLKDASVYETWYEVKHDAPDALAKAVYGLPELYRDQIKDAQLIANPGCYPTSVILGLYPLLQAGFGTNATIISDSKSGVSGAGRSAKDGNLFTQATENINPYSVGTHRHTPEITEQLSNVSDNDINVLFVPHLVPMQRGILSTIYIPNEHELSIEQVYSLYHDYYDQEYFVRLLKPGETPKTKAVSRSNFCDISIKIDEQTNMIVVMSVIDNLIKGASGQAIQNMNLMFDLPENKGLTQAPVWP